MRAVRRTVSFILLTISAILACWYFLSPEFSHNTPATRTATILKPQMPLAAFQLTDTNERPFTEHSLRGFWTLFFFGYSTCPDVCPATLSILKETWQQFPEQKAPCRLVFASINSEADSTDKLKTFLNNFHPEFTGITGNSQSMSQLTHQLAIFANPTEERLPNGEAIIEHTASLMLVDPQGKLRAVLSPPFEPQDLAYDLQLITKS